MRTLLALILGGLSTALWAQSPGLTVAVATDIHELAPSLHDNGTAWTKFATTGAGRDIVHTESLLDAFDRDLALAKPQWLLVTGDLTNNGERASHQALAARLAKIQSRGTRVLVIPGNHDVANPWARAFRGERQVVVDGVSPSEFAVLYRDFGYGHPDARDPASLSYRINASPGVWFLMLDTAEYLENQTYGQPTTEGRVSLATLGWIKNQGALAKAAGARLVVAQHHNLVDHSAVLSRGFTLDNAAEVVDVYRQVGIRLVLSGHIHTQSIAATEDQGPPIFDVATNALSVYPHQFGWLVLSSTGQATYRTRQVNVEAWARASGQTDDALVHFSRWSETDFANQGRAMAQRRLDIPDATLASQAADVMALLNLHLFAGRQDLNQGLDQTPGFRALVDADDFLANYAQAIVASDRDNNALDGDY